MAFPPLAPREVTNLSLLTAGRVVLGSFELLSYSGGEVKFNVSPMKAYESETQYFKGDARLVNENIFCTIRVAGVTEEARAIAMTAILNWLRFTRIIQIGGLSLRIAGAAGIRSWAPISEGDAKVEIEFIPSSGSFSDDILRFIDGSIWEFRYAGGVIAALSAGSSLSSLAPSVTVLNLGVVVYFGAETVFYGAEIVTYEAPVVPATDVTVSAFMAAGAVSAFAHAANTASTLIGTASVSSSLTTYPKKGPVYTGDWWVDPNAVTNGTGTEANPYNNLTSAFSSVSDGQRIIVRGGTIDISSRMVRSVNWTTGIEVFAYGNERVLVDGTAMGETSNSQGLFLSGRREHWKGFYFKYCNGEGGSVRITGNYNTLEDVWISHNSCFFVDGWERNGGGFYLDAESTNNFSKASYNVLKDCAVWRIGDTAAGGTNVPDNYAATAGGGVSYYGGYNKFVRCFSGHGPDDGYDLFRSWHNEFIDCVAYRSGYWYTGTANSGDGNGFKMGGDPSNGSGNGTYNSVIGCVAARCRVMGIVHNQSDHATIKRSTSAYNGYGIDCGGDEAAEDTVAQDNIALNNTNWNKWTGAYTLDSYNTWNLGITDASFADQANQDFSLASGSACINAGISGGTLGASSVALAILKEWAAKDLSS